MDRFQHIVNSPWIIAARMLEITLAFSALGTAIYVHTSTDWWGYLTKIYGFACCFLLGSTALFGTFSLSEYKNIVPKYVTFWIDLWAVAYFIASAILLRLCSNISWQGGISLAGAIMSFIGAGLVIMLMLRSLFLMSKNSPKKYAEVVEKKVHHDDE